MSTTAKVLIFIATILALGGMGVIIYNQINISKQQQAIQDQVIQQKALVDGLVQSANSYTTKQDLNNFIQQNTGDLKAIQDNLSSLGASITAANVVTANSQGQVATNVASTSTTPSGVKPTVPIVVGCPGGGTVTCPNSDPFGYQANQQTLALNEDFSNLKVPFGSVSFNAWQQAPWSVNIAPRQYNVTSVIGTDENQRVYVDNKFTVKVADKTYTVPITTAQTQQVYPTAKFSFWNPRLFLTTGGSINLSQLGGEANLGTTVGMMSYGKFLTNPDISVLQIGAAYQVVSKKPALILNPVSIDIGHLFPNKLINNTYLGPSVQLDTNKNFSAGVNLSIGF